MEITQSINCTEAEGCACAACVADRKRFDAWVEDTANRWARAYAEGRVAHLCGNPCSNVLCPKHGDPRDTNIISLAVRS